MLSLVAHACIRLAARAGKRGVIVNEHVLSARDTRRHVDALSRSFEFIGLEELPSRMLRRRRRPFCLLTFDDGKRSNATETAPALWRLGVPAVFYVTTGALTSGEPYWFDQWSALAKKLGRAPPGLELEALKRLPSALRLELVGRACARAGVELPHDDHDARPMSWDDARGLARRGFTVGSHGVHHGVLTREAREDALQEIELGMRHVTRELGVPCTSFAFPNGNYTAELARHAVACGATTVMTTEPLWVEAGTPLWALPRVQLFPGQGRARVPAKIAASSSGVLLRNPDGTGRAYWRARRRSRRARHPAHG